MATTIIKNHDGSPYRDDFAEAKNFHRILFKPGVSVQARELTQLQTLLQAQIDRHGQYAFKNGSRVINGKVTLDANLDYIKVEEIFTGAAGGENTTSSYLAQFVGTTITGQTSGVTATVIDSVVVGGTASNGDSISNTLYIQYTGSGTNKTTKTFTVGEEIHATNSGGSTIKAMIGGGNDTNLQTAGNTAPNPAISNPIGKGSRVNIEEGVYFIKGNFVFVAAQSLILEHYSPTPNFIVGLQVTETEVTSATDSSLLDNASGSPNHTAPGADRYQISTSLVKYAITAADQISKTNRSNAGLDNLITLIKVLDGKASVDTTDKTDDTPLTRRLAKRTFEESGNYSTEPFAISVKEYLNDTTNNGFKTKEQIIADGDAANNAAAIRFGQDRLSISIEPNIAYIEGFRVENISNKNVIVKKPRAAFNGNGTDRVDSDTHVATTETDTQKTVRVGNYALITASTVHGVPDTTSYTTINLHSAVGQGGSVIGTARVRGIKNHDSTEDRLYLFDIAMTGSNTFADVKSFQETATGNVRFLGNFKLNSDSKNILNDTGPNTMIFQLPHRATKKLDGNIKYTYKKRLTFSGTAAGTKAFTVGSDETFVNVTSSGYIAANATGGSGTQDIKRMTTNTAVLSNGNRTLTINLAHADAYGSGATATDIHIVVDVEKETNGVKAKGAPTNTNNLTGTLGTVDNVANALSLGVSDILKINSVTHNSVDVTDQFTLDNGQRDNMYVPGKIILKPGFQPLVGTLTVDFDHFVVSTSGSDDVFTVDSYNFAQYEDIPTFKSNRGSINLRDALDFRPVKNASGNFTGTGSHDNVSLVDSSVVQFTQKYYLPRIDKLILKRTGEFIVKEGVPNERAKPPVADDNALALFDFALKPYLFTLNDFKPKMHQTKRYTMKDVGSLDKRIKNLEYYTSLSLLEQSAADAQIFDGDGKSRLKNGFIVDGFFGHNIGDPANPDYSASVDKKLGHLRPKFDERNVNLLEVNGDSTTTRTKSLVTLPMTTDVTFIEQPYSSTVSNVNPYNVFTWGGVVNLTPSSDEWKEVDIRPAVIIDDTAQYDQFVQMAEEEGILGTVWNEWETNWTGVEIDTQVETFFGDNGDGELEEGELTIETKTTTSNQTRSGLSTEVGFDTVTRSNGFRVVEMNFLPFIRSRKVFFDAQLLRPNTKFYAFFDGVMLSSYAANGDHQPTTSFVKEETAVTEFADQTSVDTFEGTTVHPSGAGEELISDGSGRIIGSFIIPQNDVLKFAAGVREFRLSDDINNNKTNETSFAEVQYHAQGMLEVLEETIISTKVPKLVTNEVSEDRTIVETEVTETVEWVDPIAQTFLVDQEDGMFIKSVQVFFQTKDSNIPVRLSIRTTKNGIPTQRIVPGADKILYPSSINTSANASSGTTFSFDHPVYLNQDGEYAIVMTSQSDAYNVFIAVTGEKSLEDETEEIIKQPYGGVFFSSANASTWTPEQMKDLKFTMKRAEFDISQTRTLTLRNDVLPAKRLSGNPIFTNDTAGAGDSGTTFGNNPKILLVRHPNHGMYEGDPTDKVTISGVANAINGVPASDINGTHDIANVTHDSYTITVNTAATADGRGGGNSVRATENRHMDVMYPAISNIELPNTSIRYFARAVSGKSINGTETPRTKGARFEILPNRTFTFKNPRTIYSAPNAGEIDNAHKFAGDKTFQIEAEFSSTKSHLSPVIDMDRTSVHAIQNRIGNSGSAASGELLARGGSEIARYITKKIELAEEADVANVYLNAHRPTGGDVLLYYRALDTGSSGSIFDEPFILATTTPETSADGKVPINDTGFEEVEYSIDVNGANATFGVIQFKIVLVSASSSRIPRVKDLRAICST